MKPLRIATFNVKDLFAASRADDEAIVQSKLVAIGDEIRRARADVVALQEVGSPELLATLTREHLDGFGDAVVGTEDRRGIRNAIVTRLPIREAKVHTAESLAFPALFEGDPTPFAGRLPLRRGVVHVRVDAAELGEVDVLTVHFKSNRATYLHTESSGSRAAPSGRERGEAALRTFVQRAAEALFVRGLVDELLAVDRHRAICVLGDFNDYAESLPVRIVRGDFEPRGGELHACATSIPAERRYSYLATEAPVLIDHVLVSKGLEPLIRTFEIQNDRLRSHASSKVPSGEVPAPSIDSDHALCVVELGSPSPIT